MNTLKSFCLVIQRQAKTGQLEIELEDANNEIGANDEYRNQHYIYRCIATNMDAKTDFEIIDWYNQRAECSENKIKELKCDFGAEDLPCSDHQANSLYIGICILAYNLFVLMRALAPSILRNYRAKRARWCIYHIAGKVVRSGRQLQLNIAIAGYHVIERLLAIFQAVVPPPERVRTSRITIFNYIARPNQSGTITSPSLRLLFVEDGRSCSKIPSDLPQLLEFPLLRKV